MPIEKVSCTKFSAVSPATPMPSALSQPGTPLFFGSAVSPPAFSAGLAWLPPRNLPSAPSGSSFPSTSPTSFLAPAAKPSVLNSLNASAPRPTVRPVLRRLWKGEP
jgi:hypothetical protein